VLTVAKAEDKDNKLMSSEGLEATQEEIDQVLEANQDDGGSDDAADP
jgi:translation initiation factor eIF-2B subunit gamma